MQVRILPFALDKNEENPVQRLNDAINALLEELNNAQKVRASTLAEFALAIRAEPREVQGDLPFEEETPEQ